MAPGFQSSFIPKEPVTEEVFKKKKAGPLGMFAVSFFVIVLIIWGGLVAYKRIVKSNISSLQGQLVESGKNIDREAIQEMVDFSRKLDIVKSLVLKHQVVSGFLTSLASSTVSTVSFSELSYSHLTEGGLVVNLKGQTSSYGSVALQESVFNKNQYWKSTKFSGLNLSESGAVSFDVSVAIDPAIAIYAPNIPTAPASAAPDELGTAELDSLDDLDLSGLDI